MNKWLHRNNFSYKKPTGVPHKYSAEAQQVFVETYETLKSEAGDDEPILFIDGVHPTQGTKLAYGWMLTGKAAEPVKTSGSRTRLNIMGALNLKDIGRTIIREYDKINSHNIARFFIAIRETYPIKQKVHIILDGAGYHRTEQVKNNRYFTSKVFREEIHRFFSDKLPAIAGALVGRINDNFQLLKNATSS